MRIVQCCVGIFETQGVIFNVIKCLRNGLAFYKSCHNIQMYLFTYMYVCTCENLHVQGRIQ
jgi:hypothetical protein